MRGGRLVVAGVIVGGLVWGMRTAPRPRPLYDLKPPTPVLAELGTVHDPRDCGTVTGRVVWEGPAPAIPLLELPVSPLLSSRTESIPNPNTLRLQDSRVVGAVVWLRGVDPARSRAWDHAPVSVEATELEFVTKQGAERVRTGIVRRGEAVGLSARDPASYSIRGRGAAFFTDLLYTPERVTSRTLTDEGVVELSSATGAYWCRSHLLVSDHPYVTRTDERGEFRMEAVPSGTYDLVCWVPNWRIARLERDPELVVHVRMAFGRDVEKRTTIRVAAGGTAETEVKMGERDFP
jgi:hypothetical protein